MGRPRHTPPPYLYTGQEIEAAFRFRARTLEMLLKLDLAPHSQTGGVRGQARMFDANGLSQIAIAAGIFWSGIEIVSAGRLAQAISRHFRAAYGRPPSGLYGAARKWWDSITVVRGLQDYSALKESTINGLDNLDDAIIYAAIRRDPKDYRPGQSWPEDVYFDLVDRQYGFLGTPGSNVKVHNAISGREDQMQPEFRVSGWSRGGDVEITQLYQEFPRGWDQKGTPARAAACEIEQEFFSANDDPQGKLSLNVSRAIRRGHDRIFDLRNQRQNTSGGV